MTKREADPASATAEEAAPQMAVISPRDPSLPHRNSSKDMDVTGEDIMSNSLGKEWSTIERLHTTQERGAVVSDQQNHEFEQPLYVDVTGKILLPIDDDTTNEVIAVCHQATGVTAGL